MFDDINFDFEGESVDFLSYVLLPEENTVLKQNDCSEIGKTNQMDPFLEFENKFQKQNTVTTCFENSHSSNCNNVNKESFIKNSNNSSIFVKTRKVVQRKFPGPAGLLPEKIVSKSFNDVSKHENDDFLTMSQDNLEPMFISQHSNRIFDESIWYKMVDDFSREKMDNFILPEKFTISWIKQKASCQKLINQKAPFLAAVIKNLCINKKIITPDVTVTLTDKTDEICGTIVYDLYKQYASELTTGAIIILKQFGVLSTGTTHVITITENNLVKIYKNSDSKTNNFEDSSYNKVDVINLLKISVEDLIKNIKEVKQYKKKSFETFKPLNNFDKNFDLNYRLTSQKPKSSTSFSNINIKDTFQYSSTANNSYQTKSANIKKNYDNILLSDKSKFQFKSKNIPKANKGVINLNKNSQNCSQIFVETDNPAEKKIVENMFEGLDADSFFDDF